MRIVDEFFLVNQCDSKLWKVLASYIDRIILDINLNESYIKIGDGKYGCYVVCKIVGTNKIPILLAVGEDQLDGSFGSDLNNPLFDMEIINTEKLFINYQGWLKDLFTKNITEIIYRSGDLAYVDSISRIAIFEQRYFTLFKSKIIVKKLEYQSWILDN